MYHGRLQTQHVLSVRAATVSSSGTAVFVLRARQLFVDIHTCNKQYYTMAATPYKDQAEVILVASESSYYSTDIIGG